jgi:hypothetical protein
MNSAVLLRAPNNINEAAKNAEVAKKRLGFSALLGALSVLGGSICLSLASSATGCDTVTWKISDQGRLTLGVDQHERLIRPLERFSYWCATAYRIINWRNDSTRTARG